MTLIIASVIGLYLLLWIFAKPVKTVLAVLLKGAAGSALLLAINAVAAPLGFSIGVNPVTYAICGLLGINGFLALLCIKIII